MERIEVVRMFQDLGWHLKRYGEPRAGQRLEERTGCFQGLRDRNIRINFELDEYSAGQVLVIYSSISTHEFIDACSKIIYIGIKHEVLTVKFMSYLLPYSENFSISDIERMSEEIIRWASNQDLEALFEEHRLLPTSCAGELPFRHLAALAVAGDVEKLKFYQASFEAGDRLGFARYVTKDYIDRAFSLAEQYAAKA